MIIENGRSFIFCDYLTDEGKNEERINSIALFDLLTGAIITRLFGPKNSNLLAAMVCRYTRNRLFKIRQPFGLET